jgi:hypothetical protein
MTSLEARFWRFVTKTDGCWEWTGADNGHGYGAFSVARSKARAAHRVSWEIHNGQIPGRLWVLHKCDNRRCVNPSHLFLGDNTANVRDCVSKGRWSGGFQRATHCRAGHERVDENVSHRYCLPCRRNRRASVGTTSRAYSPEELSSRDYRLRCRSCRGWMRFAPTEQTPLTRARAPNAALCVPCKERLDAVVVGGLGLGGE